jgi:hypothetical protein
MGGEIVSVEKPTSKPKEIEPINEDTKSCDTSVSNDDDLISFLSFSIEKDDTKSTDIAVTKKVARRDTSKIFKDGQLIRHKTKDGEIIGQYSLKEDKVILDGIGYSLNKFVMRHYELLKKDRKSVSAWRECETFVNDSWISTMHLY